MTAVDLLGVSKRFGRQRVVEAVDVSTPADALTCFVGPSGSGKSTLLRLIAGLETPDAGEIRIGGERVDHLPPGRRGVAMVFQAYALYPHMDVYRNLAFGLRLAGEGKSAVDRRIRMAAELLQIDTLLQKRPRELSGGQRQRVAIGRAIVREPRVFLFDEPLSNLDAALRSQMRIELAALRRRLRATMVYVTHDQVEAMTLADHCVVLNDGRVEQAGPPLELYRRPCNRFVAGFLGSPAMNFIEAVTTHADATALTLELPDGNTLAVAAPMLAVAPDVPYTIGVRPEHVAVGAGPLHGRVMAVERLGSDTFVYLESPLAPQLCVRTRGDASFEVGDAVGFALTREHLHLFDSTGRRV